MICKDSTTRCIHRKSKRVKQSNQEEQSEGVGSLRHNLTNPHTFHYNCCCNSYWGFYYCCFCCCNFCFCCIAACMYAIICCLQFPLFLNMGYLSPPCLPASRGEIVKQHKKQLKKMNF